MRVEMGDRDLRRQPRARRSHSHWTREHADRAVLPWRTVTGSVPCDPRVLQLVSGDRLEARTAESEATGKYLRRVRGDKLQHSGSVRSLRVRSGQNRTAG
jgi:hypothetical protein